MCVKKSVRSGVWSVKAESKKIKAESYFLLSFGLSAFSFQLKQAVPAGSGNENCPGPR
jgi:hypothetical protein